MTKVSSNGLSFVMPNQAGAPSYYPDDDEKMAQFKNMLLNVIKGQNIANVLSNVEAQ